MNLFLSNGEELTAASIWELCESALQLYNNKQLKTAQLTAPFTFLPNLLPH